MRSRQGDHEIERLDVTDEMKRPPYDPEVAATLAYMLSQAPMTSVLPETISELRKAPAYDEDLRVFDVERKDVTVPGHEGADLAASVFSAGGPAKDRVGILAVHGGGMILGDRFTGMSMVMPWAVEHSAVAVTVEYRLAPEFPDPVPVEDVYAALVWMAENASELGIDPERIVIIGASAGGGIAAGVSLLARDRKGPRLLGQMLVCPMLDDRDDTVSTRQFESIGAWDRISNRTGWQSLLGERAGGNDVSIYAAPARATGLSELPPAFLDVGSAEVFRDEVVAYATQIWADGGVAELHVWPGGTHGWEAYAPTGTMAGQAAAARSMWLTRLLET